MPPSDLLIAHDSPLGHTDRDRKPERRRSDRSSFELRASVVLGYFELRASSPGFVTGWEPVLRVHHELARQIGGIAQLGKHLEHTIEVGQPGSESVDEFIEHEFTVHQTVFMLLDFLGQIVQELGLHPAEGLGSRAAAPRQFRIGVFPLSQLGRPLALGGAQLVTEFFEQMVLLLLMRNDLRNKATIRSPVSSSSSKWPEEASAETSIRNMGTCCGSGLIGCSPALHHRTTPSIDDLEVMSSDSLVEDAEAGEVPDPTAGQSRSPLKSTGSDTRCNLWRPARARCQGPRASRQGLLE